LEGTVAKWKFGSCASDDRCGIKIKNPTYSQIVGRDELFECDPEAAMEPWRGCDQLDEWFAEVSG